MWRDAHLHLFELGDALQCLHLGACTSIDDVLQHVAQAATDQPTSQWLIARGLQPERLAEHRLPTAKELDRAAGPRPCALWTLDLHAIAANTAALRAAGLLDNAQHQTNLSSIGGPHGLIERDHAGAPTGILLEAAAGIVASAMPTPSRTEQRTRLRAAITHLQSLNVIEAHEMFARADVIQALLDLETAGELDHFHLRAYATRDHLPAVRTLLADRDPAAPLQCAGLKLFLDGTLNSRTAFMLAPFADPLPDYPRGMANYTLDELLDELRFAEHERLDVAAHAIGDAAVRLALDAFDALTNDLGHEPNIQLRIEHAQFIDEADIPRFARKGKPKPIIASMQPCHLLTDMEPIVRLLPHRANRAFALRDLVDAATTAQGDPAGCIYLGSDAPVVPANPLDNRQACINRRRANMPPDSTIAPQQSVDETTWAHLQHPLRYAQ
ncbi:MAG: amidohydrolase family protein [Phycisphaerales bacterium]|nr:amidohydrolase family protein [Phycisphaerales bacterium]